MNCNHYINKVTVVTTNYKR